MSTRRSARWSIGILVVLVFLGIVLALPGAAFSLVGTSAVDNVPYIQIQGTGDNYARVSTEVGSIVYVGGTFSTVYEPLSGTNYPRHDLYAYDQDTKLVTSFAPSFNGTVWGLAHSPDGRYLYVAGDFSTVDGVAREGLAQFDLTTGGLTSFDAQLDGQARTVDYVNGHLIVGGSFTAVNGVSRVGLASLDPATGALQASYLNAGLSGTASSAAGAGAVFHSAVNSAGAQMAIAGNFTSAGGATHWRVILLDLGPTSATVSGWNAPILEQPCNSANYVTGLSYAPDGTWFAMSTTGFRNETNGFPLTQTVCDAVSRFSTSAVGDVAPTWVNYTGCDSLYSVLVESDAVYVGGHPRWLDNPEGCDEAGPGSVSRPGVGAVDPATGQALSWDPTRSRGIGADFLAMTSLGLTVLSDCADSGISTDPSSGANYLAQTFHPCVGVLATPTATTETLNVSNAGSGTGTVTSSPSGISCGASCSHDFIDGTTVTLTATPATGSSFSGWSGACTGTGTCTVVMNQAGSVIATFAPLPEGLSVSKAGSGTGTVTSSPTGIGCGPACSGDFAYGTSVTLTATPAKGSSFSGWSNGCTGTGICTLTMNGAQSVTATFELPACMVPRITGEKLGVAKRALRKAHCRSGKIRYRYSPRAKGQVISQRPKSRKHLRNGTKVNFIVSKGRRH
jgi:List-Bact-rpt repeat protein/cortical protein marker for cell polarity/PASTA domain-containing protein